MSKRSRSPPSRLNGWVKRLVSFFSIVLALFIRYESVEKRRESRFEIDQAVELTILSEPQAHMAARVRNASGRGLGLLVPAPVPAGVAVRIGLDDAIVLGEAIYCRPEEERFLLGVELDQVLVGLTELGRKLAAWETEMPVGILDGRA